MPDPAAVNSMFARIAARYDLGNRVLSLGVDRAWRRQLVRAVAAGHPRDVLDVATGSGDVAFALADQLGPAVCVTGMDFCQPMLDAAERKKSAVAARYAKVTFRPGVFAAATLVPAILPLLPSAPAADTRRLADRRSPGLRLPQRNHRSFPRPGRPRRRTARRWLSRGDRTWAHLWHRRSA